MMTAITTTAFMSDLIVPCIGMNRVISQRRKPITISVRTMFRSGMGFGIPGVAGELPAQLLWTRVLPLGMGSNPNIAHLPRGLAMARYHSQWPLSVKKPMNEDLARIQKHQGGPHTSATSPKPY